MRAQTYTDTKIHLHDKEQHVLVLHALERNIFYSHFVITFESYRARKLHYQLDDI